VKALAEKAKAYGVPGESADGNDVLAVYEVTKRGVEQARAGGGVTLIELHTYRRKGHAEHDNQSYVPKEELAYWEARDPVDRYVRRLDETGWVDAAARAAVDARVADELDAAVATAEAGVFPDPEEALEGVWVEPARLAPLWYRELADA
jgi:pyruvate dehydrogenase E1 component alpha subunit/2-oxoisovalerate dehydrogenase E1 component alpha subunit